MNERNKTNPNEFFETVLRPIIEYLDDEDKVKLSKFLFSAFSDTAYKYYRSVGMLEDETVSMVGDEHEGLKKLLVAHLKLKMADLNKEQEKVDAGKPDDQFVNDALIDLNLMIKDISSNGE